MGRQPVVSVSVELSRGPCVPCARCGGRERARGNGSCVRCQEDRAEVGRTAARELARVRRALRAAVEARTLVVDGWPTRSVYLLAADLPLVQRVRAALPRVSRPADDRTLFRLVSEVVADRRAARRAAYLQQVDRASWVWRPELGERLHARPTPRHAGHL